LPRISDVFSDCIFYIYNSLEDAQREVKAGASGFMATVSSEEQPGSGYAYAVTNRHVVLSAHSPVIRFNRNDGKTECITTNREDWTLHPAGDDVAAFPLAFDTNQIRIQGIGTTMFVTHELIRYEDVGIGDNVFMIGRFINHEGIDENLPALRFGNIAMMPKMPIVDATSGIKQEAFLVEMRSIQGYSGSPVFLYSIDAIGDMSNRDLSKEQDEIRQKSGFDGQRGGLDPGPLAFMSPKGPFLLGVDFCHIHKHERVLDSKGEEIGRVRMNTGMAGVVPAWRIMELLNCEDLVKNRQKSEDDIRVRKSESHVSLDTSETEQVFTEEDFEKALRQVSRRVDSSESDSKNE
jgi:hypothetical protein